MGGSPSVNKIGYYWSCYLPVLFVTVILRNIILVAALCLNIYSHMLRVRLISFLDISQYELHCFHD